MVLPPRLRASVTVGINSECCRLCGHAKRSCSLSTSSLLSAEFPAATCRIRGHSATAVAELWDLCELWGGRWELVCFMFSQACFSLHFQIGRSALVTSSSSLPSFPSTLSWSRDESARRVKYTLNALPWRRAVLLGLCAWALALVPLPLANCPLSCMQQRFAPGFSQQQAHAAMHI